MSARSIVATLALVLLTSPAFAQDGNGVGNAFLKVSPARLGDTYVIDFGSPGLAGGAGIISVSDGYGPTEIPGFGTLWLDLFSPAKFSLPVTLDANGLGTLAFPLPASPFLTNSPPLYFYFAVVDLSLPAPSVSISKTVRLELENGDAYKPTVQAMQETRSHHQATALGADSADNSSRVLVTGGGDGDLLNPTARNTTELFLPLTREFSFGPNMSVARTGHRAVRLGSGHILITGGIQTGGAVTATCEVYDPVADVIFPTGAMNSPRAGHTVSLLPNGSVLVTGGITSYVNASSQLQTVLGTSQDTAEIYDPTSGSWTLVAGTMAARRTGHTATALADGRILLVAGITGAAAGGSIWPGGNTVPTHTATCDLFDPATGTFTVAANLPASLSFHGASRLGNGDVLVTGGMRSNIASATIVGSVETYRFSSQTETWSAGGDLPIAVAFHQQVTGASGKALVFGGFTLAIGNAQASALSGSHDGVNFTPGNPIGTNPGMPQQGSAPTALQTVTTLQDGSFLVLGGDLGTGNGGMTQAYVFVE